MDYGSAKKSLSSKQTIYYKFILPAFLIFVSGLGAFATLITNSKFAGGLIGLLIFVILICALICFPLKTVKIDDSYLFISNYRKTIQIPVTEIEEVTDILYISPRLIWVKFKNTTEFGESILFMPYFDLGEMVFMAHPVADLLKEIAKRNKN